MQIKTFFYHSTQSVTISVTVFSIQTKKCLTTVKQVFFSYTTEGSLVDIGAYQPYTLAGPPVL